MLLRKKEEEKEKHKYTVCSWLKFFFHDFPSKKTLRRQAHGCGGKKKKNLSLERIVIPSGGTQHEHFDVNLKERRG